MMERSMFIPYTMEPSSDIQELSSIYNTYEHLKCQQTDPATLEAMKEEQILQWGKP